jgi:HPt (histidine-containing phosphotransfer) domain-containing protein
MGVTTIDRITDLKSLRTSMCDPILIDDAVDLSVLTSFEEVHVDGEPDLVVELIDLYLDDAPQKLKAMRIALSLRDSNSLRDVAHSLKGSSSSLGARQVAALCEEIEKDAIDLSSQEANTVLIRVEHEFDRVRLAFAAERHRRQS